MDFIAFKNGAETAFMRVLSTGGGAISVIGRPDTETPEVYPECSFREIADYCKAHNRGSRIMWRSARARISGITYLKSGM